MLSFDPSWHALSIAAEVRNPSHVPETLNCQGALDFIFITFDAVTQTFKQLLYGTLSLIQIEGQRESRRGKNLK